jgi:hypothetical protein
MPNTIRVKLISFGEKQRISDKFTKLEVEMETIGEYSTPLLITFSNRQIEVIENVETGSIGELKFDLRGYKSKDGRVFVNVVGLGFDIDSSYAPAVRNTKEGQPKKYSEVTGSVSKKEVDDDLPF